MDELKTRKVSWQSKECFIKALNIYFYDYIEVESTTYMSSYFTMICSDNQVQRLYRSDTVPRIRQTRGQALDSAYTKGESSNIDD